MPRPNRKSVEPVYLAAERFVQVALRGDDSLFTPGRAIWALEVCTDLRARFTERPDTSKNTFEAKFRRQLADAPPNTIQLAGELLFVYFLASMQVGYDTKRSLIERVLSWSPQPVAIPQNLLPALKDGLGNAGTAFNTRRPFLLWFLLEFVIRWKELPEQERGSLLQDPWAFKGWVFEVPGDMVQTQQHALLNLIHPDAFEPITSQYMKRDIAAAFVGLIDPVPEDVDKQLAAIREKLTPTYGASFNFYDSPIREEWEHRPPQSYEEESLSTASRCWIEKTLVSGRPGREGGDHALGKALWSPQKSKDDRNIYRAMRSVSPGDVVFHFIDNDHFAGISRVASGPDMNFTGLPDTEWAGRPAIRVQLGDYVALDPPILRGEIFQDPSLRPRLVELLAKHKRLFFKRDFDLNQGAYLTEAPPELVTLLDELYRKKTGRGLPHIKALGLRGGTGDGGGRLTTAHGIEWLMNETLWTRQQLEAPIDAIRSRTKQIILAGPPGTSKTWVAKRLATYLTQGRSDGVRIVQFHPSYSYEEFIEGIRPVVKDGGVQFARVDGVVRRIAGSITNEHDLSVLIIDEMNRANLPRVLGELMYAFEYRDELLDLQYSQGFRLPNNLVFIGTMNTADRSIRSIDIALRRRFDVFECLPEAAILKRYYESRENRVDDLLDGFERLNSDLEERLDRHHTIGHTFFMANPMTLDLLGKIWRHKLGPLIEEYFFDQPDIAREFLPGRYWKGL